MIKRQFNRITKKYIKSVEFYNIARHNNIDVLDFYGGVGKKVFVRCKNDGYSWFVATRSISKGVGCPKCYGNIKKTHSEYVDEVKNINCNISVVGEYNGNKEKIRHKCKIDGHEWMANPNSVLRGSGCPKCYGHIKKDTSQYSLEISDRNISVIGDYKNNNFKILHRCNIDGYEWEATPSNILSGSGCPKCSKKQRRTQDEYKKELSDIHKNIEIISKFNGMNKKAKYRCLIDDNVWEANPYSILVGNGCPKCSGSKGEKDILFYLKERGIPFISEKTFSFAKKKRYDFFVGNYVIEFDGQQHFSHNSFLHRERSLNETQNSDKLKTKLAIINGYNVIRISYSEIKNIEKILNVALKSNKIIQLFGKEYELLDIYDDLLK